MRTALILSLFFLAACGDEEQSLYASKGVTGTWRLIEVLADPGDGSGKFQPVDSNNRLTFSDDGIVTISTQFCPLSDFSSQSGIGTYTFNDNAGEITPNDCTDWIIPYSIEGELLLLGNYHCIEPCGAKYKKISEKTD